jgi:putative membrane protein
MPVWRHQSHRGPARCGTSSNLYIKIYNTLMKIFIHWFLSALAIAIAAYLIPGIGVAGVVPALVLALVLAAINTFIRPVLMVLTLPFSIMTLGLFALVLNTLLIMLAAAVVPGVTVSGFLSAFIFGIVLALVSATLKSFQD